MITVVEPGPLSSVQDPVGRPGWRRYGVAVGGAADAWSARLANRLVGNPDAAALIEVTIGGAAFAFERPTTVAVTGGLLARGDRRPLPAHEGLRVGAGAEIALEPGTGARGYVAIGGGIAVTSVLGSPSTDLRSGFGGHEGRALRAGDRLAVIPGDATLRRWDGTRSGPIRVVSGPHPEGFDALVSGRWEVGAEADRAGVRLTGPALAGGEVASVGLPLGAVQLPPDGRPIIMLADRPVTGGYAVVACVIGADVGRVAQLRTGDEVAFEAISVDAARVAWREAQAELDRLEPSSDEGLGWVGAHS